LRRGGHRHPPALILRSQGTSLNAYKTFSYYTASDREARFFLLRWSSQPGADWLPERRKKKVEAGVLMITLLLALVVIERLTR
jgi:hypothetical protein